MLKETAVKYLVLIVVFVFVVDQSTALGTNSSVNATANSTLNNTGNSTINGSQNVPPSGCPNSSLSIEDRIRLTPLLVRGYLVRKRGNSSLYQARLLLTRAYKGYFKNKYIYIEGFGHTNSCLTSLNFGVEYLIFLEKSSSTFRAWYGGNSSAAIPYSSSSLKPILTTVICCPNTGGNCATRRLTCRRRYRCGPHHCYCIRREPEPEPEPEEPEPEEPEPEKPEPEEPEPEKENGKGYGRSHGRSRGRSHGRSHGRSRGGQQGRQQYRYHIVSHGKRNHRGRVTYH